MNILNEEVKVNVIQQCNDLCDVDIIMPSFQDRRMSTLAARSFFKFEKKLKIKVIFVDPSNSTEKFDLDNVTLLSVKNTKSTTAKSAGYMSHSNAFSLEVGRQYVTSKYVFVCHNDVLAYTENWLSYLYDKMTQYRLVGFVGDNSRIKAVHVSGFMYDVDFFKDVTFWPKDNPERDVGDDFTYYLQKKKLPYFICPCSHNDPSLLKPIHAKYKELKKITGDKCLDDKGNVLYIHTGRGTVKMIGNYKKENKTTFKEWVKFAEKIL